MRRRRGTKPPKHILLFLCPLLLIALITPAFLFHRKSIQNQIFKKEKENLFEKVSIASLCQKNNFTAFEIRVYGTFGDISSREGGCKGRRFAFAVVKGQEFNEYVGNHLDKELRKFNEEPMQIDRNTMKFTQKILKVDGESTESDLKSMESNQKSRKNVGVKSPDADFFGFRLPFYTSRDPARVYRCRIFTLALVGRKTHVALDLNDQFRLCCLSGNFSISKAIMGMQTTLTDTTQKEPPWKAEILAFLKQSKEVKSLLQAIQRIEPLKYVGAHRMFFLQSEEHIWVNRLPSEQGQHGFADINAHRTELPMKNISTLFARDVQIERNGRVIVPDTLEVFYPRRAPWSHMSLMEQFVNEEKTEFQPSKLTREGFRKKMIRNYDEYAQCLAKAVPREVTTCGVIAKDTHVAVDRVFVISQTLADQMFHFFSECLPRIGPYLRLFDEDPDLFLHASCDWRHHGYCPKLLELLGIPRNRIIHVERSGNAQTQFIVNAKFAIIPEGGRRHWPMANIWGIRAVRDRILSRNFLHDKSNENSCFMAKSTGEQVIHVVMFKRALTRLSYIESHWYDRLCLHLRTKSDLKHIFRLQDFNVTLFDDADTKLMADLEAQIRLIRQADIVVGAHGAGFSLMMFAKSCTHFVSFRGRTNSDIFEQYALSLGMGFHHIRFDNDYPQLYLDVVTAVGTAINEHVRRTEPHALSVGLYCDVCTSLSALRRLRKYFDIVVVLASSFKDSLDALPLGVYAYDDLGDNDDAYNSVKHKPCVPFVRRSRDFIAIMAPSNRQPLFWAWTRNESIVMNSHYRHDWTLFSRADAVMFSTHFSQLTTPFLIVVRNQPAFEEFCALTSDDSIRVFESFPSVHAVFVASSFSGTISLKDGRLFYPVESSKRRDFEQLAANMDMNGPYRLSPMLAKVHVADSAIVVIKMMNGSFLKRFFPFHTIAREETTAESLLNTENGLGTISYLEVPFTFVQDLKHCRLERLPISGERGAGEGEAEGSGCSFT